LGERLTIKAAMCSSSVPYSLEPVFEQQAAAAREGLLTPTLKTISHPTLLPADCNQFLKRLPVAAG
jgi:hypothetical protein